MDVKNILTESISTMRVCYISWIIGLVQPSHEVC